MATDAFYARVKPSTTRGIERIRKVEGFRTKTEAVEFIVEQAVARLERAEKRLKKAKANNDLPAESSAADA